jgi:RecB family endonuclease NucS
MSAQRLLEAVGDECIDGVEQLTGYLELLNRDPRLAPVKGVFAAQEIKPQARVLAQDRGIDCVTVDYAVLKGTDDPSMPCSPVPGHLYGFCWKSP